MVQKRGPSSPDETFFFLFCPLRRKSQQLLKGLVVTKTKRTCQSRQKLTRSVTITAMGGQNDLASVNLLCGICLLEFFSHSRHNIQLHTMKRSFKRWADEYKHKNLTPKAMVLLFAFKVKVTKTPYSSFFKSHHFPLVIKKPTHSILLHAALRIQQ